MRLFRREKRNAVSWPDALVEHLSQTPDVSATTTAAVETASGMLARAFAGAEIDAAEPVASSFDARLRALVGRALIRRGETVLLLDGGRLEVASSWWVDGPADPTRWTYRLYLTGPSAQRTVTVRADSVLHFRWATDPALPWRGIGPLEAAKLAGRLSAETVAALGDEAATTRGYLMPLPKDGEDPTIDKMKQDIGTAKGKMLAVESQTLGEWPVGDRQSVAGSGWAPVRFGANPPAVLVEQARLATAEVLAACGVPIPLADATASDTGQKEAWRRFLSATVQPLGQMISAEIVEKTGRPASMGWADLRSNDLVSRTRGFKQMIESGASFESAATAAGLDLEEGETPEPAGDAPPAEEGPLAS